VIFRIRFRTHGHHVRCRLFIASLPDRAFAYCGEFTVRDGEEFDALMEALKAEFVSEDAP
jgi:hypothetical protein